MSAPDGTDGLDDNGGRPAAGPSGALGRLLRKARRAWPTAITHRPGYRRRSRLFAVAGGCIVALALALLGLQARGDLQSFLGRLHLGTSKVDEAGRRATPENREPAQDSRPDPIILAESSKTKTVVTCYAIPIAAYRADSFDKARVLEEVNGLLVKFGLDDLKVVLSREPVVVGGQPFIRAMAGTFRTAAEARARCVAVKGVDAGRWCEPLALLSTDYPCET